MVIVAIALSTSKSRGHCFQLKKRNALKRTERKKTDGTVQEKSAAATHLLPGLKNGAETEKGRGGIAGPSRKSFPSASPEQGKRPSSNQAPRKKGND